MKVTALAVALFAVRAHAAGYVVDPSGSDANDGSAAHPWKTLQHAADSVTAGDTVRVHAGTYAGFSVGFENDAIAGTAAAPIAFLADDGATITTPNADTADGIDLEPGCDFWDLEGFTVTNAGGAITRAGIRVTTSDGVVVRNNRVDGCGTWGIFTSHADHVRIEGNTCSNAGTQHGIYVSNACVEPVVRGNTLFGNAGCGLHLNGDASQGGTGVITGALVEDNVIHDNGAAGGSGINGDGLQGSTIQNNLLYANHASGISLFQIDAAEPATNNVVVNNTIVMASDGRWAVNITDASTGNVVLDNILFDENPSHGAITVDSASLSGFVSDHNVVTGTFSLDDSNLSLADWRAQTSQDASSLASTETANFVAPGSDFHLVAGAPAVGAGTSQHAPATDLDGHARSGAIDVGAYAFGGDGSGTGSTSSGSGSTGGSSSSGSTSSGSTSGSSSGSSGSTGDGSTSSSGGGCSAGGDGLALLGLFAALSSRRARRGSRAAEG